MDFVHARADGRQEQASDVDPKWPPPLVLELTVKQLLDMPDEGQRLAGATVNMLWEAHCRDVVPYYDLAAAGEFGPDRRRREMRT